MQIHSSQTLSPIARQQRPGTHDQQRESQGTADKPTAATPAAVPRAVSKPVFEPLERFGAGVVYHKPNTQPGTLPHQAQTAIHTYHTVASSDGPELLNRLDTFA